MLLKCLVLAQIFLVLYIKKTAKHGKFLDEKNEISWKGFVLDYSLSSMSHY